MVDQFSESKVVADPAADTEAWIAARRRYRLLQRGVQDNAPTGQISELEKYLRKTCLIKRPRKATTESGGVVPQKYTYSSFFEAKRTEALSCGK